MPRRRTVNLNLPEGMRARTWSSGKTYYYLEAAGKTTPLGADYLEALRKYCDIVQTAARPAVTWLAVVKRYQVEARHLRLYQQWRLATKAEAESKRRKEGKAPSRKGDGKVAVNREITLFSTIWQWARTKEFTRQECPARDVERYPERGRWLNRRGDHGKYTRRLLLAFPDGLRPGGGRGFR